MQNVSSVIKFRNSSEIFSTVQIITFLFYLFSDNYLRSSPDSIFDMMLALSTVLHASKGFIMYLQLVDPVQCSCICFIYTTEVWNILRKERHYFSIYATEDKAFSCQQVPHKLHLINTISKKYKFCSKSLFYMKNQLQKR